MRIVLGICTIYEAWTRLDLLRIYYTDAGPTPRSLTLVGSFRWQSLWSLGGSYGFALTLLIAHALLGVLLTIGWFTRTVIILLLISLWSLINRNPTLSHGGNNLEVWLLIWSIFLPIGGAASIDARDPRYRWPWRRVANLATLAMLVQVAFVYWNALVVKNNVDWRSDFSAIYYFLNSHLGTPLGYALGQAPMLCELLTITTLGLELFGPIFALVTFSMPRTRTAIALIFIAFHIGLSATMYVGAFSYICIAAWLIYIPTPVWDRIWRFKRTHANPVEQRRPNLVPQMIAGALFAYIVIVNLVGFIPKDIRTKTGPLARLPRIKQSWGVMDVPWRYFQTLVIEVEQSDGTMHIINADDAPDGSFAKTVPTTHKPSEYWNWPVWWNERCCLVEYRSTLLLGALEHKLQWIAAYVDYHRRKWDEAHPSPGQQVKSIKAYVQIHPTKSPTGTPNTVVKEGRKLLYEWPAPTVGSAIQPAGK